MKPTYSIRGEGRFPLFKGGSFQGELVDAARRFDGATIEHQNSYLQAILRETAADNDQPASVSDLPSVTEYRVHLEDRNATWLPYPQQSCIQHLFEEQVLKSPEAPAVIHEDCVLSYGEINAEANRLAHYLIELGVGPGNRVAICVERSAAMVIGLLAILKARGAYVPLDPAYPSERLGQVMYDASPLLVLIDTAGRTALGDAVLASRILVDLDPMRQQTGTSWRLQPVKNPLVPTLTSRHLAYVIYTSGSTGTPKGVMIEHHSLINFHQAMKRDIYRGETRRRIGWNASFSFDMSMKGFLQLLSGHALIIIPDKVRATSAGFLRFLREQVIDGFDVTPSQLRALIGEGLLEEERPRTVLVGGEAIDPVLWQQLKSCRTIEFHNMYGPTECTVDATMSVIGSKDATAHIGRPLANTQMYILDGHGEPVTAGATGEMYIGGVGVGRGYWKRPELTALRFVPDPFGGEAGARLYRTGDLARYLPGGDIEYIGRNDFQVKIRGFRIELGEIEARLAEYPGIGEVVVLAREDTPGHPRLVAYFVAAETDLPFVARELRCHLSASLPEYMVPAAYVRLETMPLTPNGKLDRKALPAPGQDAFATCGYEAPQTETETVLAEIWANVLKLDRVGRHDNFFDLGGHSLMATKVISRVRQQLGVELPLRSLFGVEALEQMGKRVDAERIAVPAAPEVPLTRVVSRGLVPLSYGQQRLWFLEQVEPGKANYNVPVVLRLTGNLDERALEHALASVVERHEVLRTRLAVGADEETPFQQIDPPGGIRLERIDMTTAGDEAAERWIAEEAQRPFDLARGPLLRASLVRMEAGQCRLCLMMHHSIVDGWSVGILLRELGEIYMAQHEHRPSALPPLAVQYADFAVWQRHWMAGEVYERQRQYWTRQLNGLQPLELPTDFPRPPVPSFRGATERFTIPPELKQKLVTLSQGEGATLFMTLLAGFQLLLARYSGASDIAVGSPVANRNRAEIEDLIGFFVNTLVFRTEVRAEMTFRQLLQQVRTSCLEAYAHQDMPFEKLVQELQPERDLSRSPLFQVMFVFQNAAATNWALGNVNVTRMPTSTGTAKFDLQLALHETAEELAGEIEFSSDLFTAATVRRMASHYVRLLEAVVANGNDEVARLPLLSDEERRQIVEQWNGTGRRYTRATCVHEWIEEHAGKTPTAPAVEYEDGWLNYAELNRRANRLAHYLRGQGIGSGQRVGLFLERGWEMVVALLGVLKSGAAYVPLDPEYPAERLQYMLGDSDPVLVLTHSRLRRELGGAVPVLELDREAGKWLDDEAIAESNPEFRGQRGAHRLAYMIYTSGSTGRPKGVMVEHGGLSNRIAWMQEAYRLVPGDAVLQKTPYGFDVSVWEFLWPLSHGARLVMARPGGHKDPNYLVRLIREKQITVMHFVPSMLGMFLEQLEREPSPEAACRSLRLLVSSGEALPGLLVQRTQRRLPWVALENLYGPTEATVDVTSWTCPQTFAGNRVPIGRPIANTQMYILDGYGEPVPTGVTGELYIGGIGVGRGYWNRSDLTAARFVPNQFGRETGARLYRTGDLARYLPDGDIEYLGRNDFQVKIRGFRIELGEIEARLNEHPGVLEAVVLAREDTAGQSRLIAYFVATAAGVMVDTHELRCHLGDRLPEHMVPAAYVRLEDMPLTPNGKLDRKALPAADQNAFANCGYEDPEGETETLLAEIWANLLKLDRIGRHDNFFALGGHSLMAVRLTTKIRQKFDVDLPIREVFLLPVLSTLADRVLTLQLEQFNATDIAFALDQLQLR